MVWRLVFCLLGHLSLLLFLAFYLAVSIKSVRLYAPSANAQVLQMESLHTVPSLLEAMDAMRSAWQKSGDQTDRSRYLQMRQSVLYDLDSLKTPLLLASPEERKRRELVRQWISQVGDVAVDHPPLVVGQTDELTPLSRQLLGEVEAATSKVRAEAEATLARLQSDEARESTDRVNLMWIVVGTITFVTILIQLLLANSIIRPIQTLAGVVRRLQGGDYQARSHLNSGDEIQHLGETFNAMAENIVVAQQELEDKNARLSLQQEALRKANVGLEERVADKTRELEEKNQKLNEAAKLKDEFLATLSHELRTPLTPVISCAHLLGTDPALDAGQQKNVNVIERNARALSRMIDELLDLSSVMNRKLRLFREKTEINEWIRFTLETMRASWEKKQLELTFIPEQRPVEWEIDPTRLAQVLTNLITNAIKYTESGGKITVRLKASADEMRIAVTDTGTGLTERDIGEIFEMFHQSRTRQTQSVGGLGVGLTVARSLAELHGGGLLAESPGPGLGATFTLWLPNLSDAQMADAPPSLAPALPAVDRRLLRGRRILLVEDSVDTREAMQRIFLRRECLVSTAGSGEEAMEIALREPPDIIISDIGLPGMTGLEFMTKLRARPDFQGLVAIALSGLGREQDLRGATAAGFDAHLLKPVDIAVLDSTLVQAIQKKNGR